MYLVIFAPYASVIPLAVLAGILIKVGFDILDYRFIKVWKNSPRHDLLVMLVVFVMTVFVDLITAVGVGVVLASILIVYRLTKETNITLDTENSSVNNEFFLQHNARVIKINGPFFFGSSTIFENNVNTILDTKSIVIDILDVPFVDITAIFTLKDLLRRLNEEGVEVIIVSSKKIKIGSFKIKRV
jgi:SulP family sulfate permease